MPCKNQTQYFSKFENCFKSMACDFLKIWPKCFSWNYPISHPINWELTTNLKYLSFINIPGILKVMGHFLKQWTDFSEVKGQSIKFPITQSLLKIFTKTFLFLNLLTSLMLNFHIVWKKWTFNFSKNYKII